MPSRRHLTAANLRRTLLSLALLPAAAWPLSTPNIPVGPAFRPHAVTAHDQSDTAVATFPDGSFVVAWQHSPDNTFNTDIRAREFRADGQPAGDEFTVNTHTTGAQRSPAVAAAPDGTYVIVWASDNQDGDGGGIYRVRITPRAPHPVEARVNVATAGDQVTPDVAMDAAGNFVVTWASEQVAANEFDVYARRFNAAGAAASGEFRVNATVSGRQWNPAIARDDAGAFAIAWDSDPLQFPQVDPLRTYLQRYTAAGVKLGGQVLVDESRFYSSPDVAWLAGGRVLVSYRKAPSTPSATQVRFKQYSDAGAEIASHLVDTGSEIGDVRVATDARDNYMVVWSARAGVDENFNPLFAVFGQRFIGTFSPVLAQQPKFQVAPAAVSHSVIGSLPEVSMDADGDALIAWEQFEQASVRTDVYAQRWAGMRAIDVSLDLQGPSAPVVAGTPYVYTLAAQNHHGAVPWAGYGGASGLQGALLLPPGATLLDATGEGWNCFGGTSAVTCDLDAPLAPASVSAPVTITVLAPAQPGTRATRGDVEGQQYDPDGGNNARVLSTTFAARDASPDPFELGPASGGAGMLVESSQVVVGGINAPVAISLLGHASGRYRIGDGPWTSQAGTVAAGETVRLRLRAPDAGRERSVTISVGDLAVEWVVSGTLDDAPDAFDFPDRTGLDPGQPANSKVLTLAGFSAPAAVSIAGVDSARYRINGGAWTAAPGTLAPGQTLQLRVLASETTGGAATAVVTVGGVSDFFTAYTQE